MINTERIEASDMHDYEVIRLDVDYTDAAADLHLKDPYGKAIIIHITEIRDISVTHKEPWGKGTYIASSSIETNRKNRTLMLELNSGDNIVLQFTGTIEQGEPK
jgi:hypothetical protein